MKAEAAVTLVFASRAEAARASGLITLSDQIDSAPFHRRITIRQEGLSKAVTDLREDGFTDLRIEIQ